MSGRIYLRALMGCAGLVESYSGEIKDLTTEDTEEHTEGHRVEHAGASII